jgi:hypothetical protein
VRVLDLLEHEQHLTRRDGGAWLGALLEHAACAARAASTIAT